MHAAEDCRGVLTFDTSDCARKPCMILYASRDICCGHYLRGLCKSMSLFSEHDTFLLQVS